MYINQSSGSAGTGAGGIDGGNNAHAPTQSSWYAAMAKAWGNVLDKQASKLVNLSENLNKGLDDPGMAVQLSAESHRLTFLSTAAQTANNSAGQALETLAKKQ